MSIAIISRDTPWTKNLVSKLTSMGVKHRWFTELDRQKLEECKPSWVFFFHWSQIVDEDIFNKHRCVVIHTGTLPYHRGGTPIQNQIIRGVKTTDVNLITMEKQLDAGDIYCKQTISLQGSLRDIWMIISDTAAELIKKCIDHDLKPAPQPEVRGHTFKRIKTKPLDFLAKDDIIQVYDEIRMLDAENYPSCYIEIGEYRLEFSRAKIEEDNIISDVRIFKK